MKTSAALILALSMGALLTGCEGAQSEKDMIAEAQFCLDDASDGASADACLAKISGLNSPQANTLRCAGGFIAAQITSPQNLSNALNAISDGKGASALLTSLSFPTVSLASQTFGYCNASSQNGLKLIGAMAKSATILAEAAKSLNLGSCSNLTECSPDDLETGIQDLITNINTPSAQEAVIEIVSSIQTVYSSTCTGTSTANSDICGQIDTAIADSGFDITTTDQAQLLEIGKKLLGEWKDN